MIRGLYSAATALDALTTQQDVVAHNLAHVNHAGYKRRVTAFETWIGNNALLGTKASVHNDMRPGMTVATDRPLDVQIESDTGFFVVAGRDGPLYTRNGTFQINSQGQIITMEGLALQGTDGPLAVPPETVTIEVQDSGTVLADSIEVGQIQVVEFADPRALIRAGDSLFRAPPGVRPNASDAQVMSGVREGSNVDVVGEMTQMIAGLRHYEASQRALRSLGDVIQMNTRPGG